MEFIDLKTIFFTYTITNAICAGVVWVLWNNNRGRFAGLGLCFFNFIFQTLGTLLIGTRGIFPDWISMIVANVFLILGPILLLIGLERFLDKPGIQIQNIIILVLFTLIQTYFTIFQPDLAMRGINVSAAGILICVQIAWLMLYRAKRNILFPVTKWVGVIFAIYALIGMLRIGIIIFIPPGNDFFTESGFFNSILIISYQMLFIILTFLLFFMMNHRLFLDLKEKHQLYSQMFTDHSAIQLLIDPESGSIVEANPSACKFYGYPLDVLQKMNINLINTFSPQEVSRLIHEAKDLKTNFFIFTHRLASGEIRDVEVHSVPIVVNGKQLLYSIIHDITERRLAEKELEESRAVLLKEQRFNRILFDTSPAFIVAIDMNDKIIMMNRSMLEALEYSLEDVLGKDYLNTFVPEEERSSVSHIFDQIAQKGIFRENNILSKTGKALLVQWHGRFAISNDESNFFVGIGIDITKRKQAEMDLCERESRIKNISNNFTAGMIYQVIIPPEGTRKLTYLSDSVRQLYGISPEEGMADSSLIYGRIHEDDIASLTESENEAIETLSTFRKEARVKDPSGEIRWSDFVSTPKLLDDGSTCWDGIEFIITERKLAEEKIMKSLREKETLIRELYHRTKNTMQIIRGMLVLQAAEYPMNVELQELIKNTEDRIQSMALVHQMLYKSQDLSQISIKEYIHELAALIFQSFRVTTDRIALDIQIDDQYFLLDTAIPFGLILTELMTNSLEYAFPDNMEGKISINLSRDESDKNTLHYSDNGVGVPDGFDFRNKRTLGLKLIHSIGEQQMMGKIEMKNFNGVTCLFTFQNNLNKVRV